MCTLQSPLVLSFKPFVLLAFVVFLGSPALLAHKLYFEPSQITIIEVDKTHVGLSADGFSAFYTARKQDILRVHLALASAISLGVPIEVEVGRSEIAVGYAGSNRKWLVDPRYIRHVAKKGGVSYFFTKAGFRPLKIAEFKTGESSNFATYVAATANLKGAFLEVSGTPHVAARFERNKKDNLDTNSFKLNDSPEAWLIHYDDVVFLSYGQHGNLKANSADGKPMVTTATAELIAHVRGLLKVSPYLEVICLRRVLGNSYLKGDESNALRGKPGSEDVNATCRLIRRVILNEPVQLGLLPGKALEPMGAASVASVYLAPPQPSAPPGDPQASPSAPFKIFDAAPFSDSYHYTERDVRLILLRAYGVDPVSIGPEQPIRAGDTFIFPPIANSATIASTVRELANAHCDSKGAKVFIPVRFGDHWVGFHVSYTIREGHPHIQVLALVSALATNDVLLLIEKVFADFHRYFDTGGASWTCATSVVYGAAHADHASSAPLLIENLITGNFSNVGKRDLGLEEVRAIREKHVQLLAKYGETLDGPQVVAPAAPAVLVPNAVAARVKKWIPFRKKH